MERTDLSPSRVIRINDDEYPENLKLIDTPPEKIYYRGDKELLYRRSIAIVGSRRCSEYGKNVAMKIAGQAVRNGFCVISGMAIGIDNFAHQGALRNDGKTIAVLGSGADICYPRQHRGLYEDISKFGLIVSELPDGTEPRPYSFPRRNRIIAGLSEAVVVVEARMGSGSLITAECADSQNKPVFAVPGNINSQYSLGTNRLIVEGAQIVSVIDDIFNYLGVSPVLDDEELKELGEDEREIYEFVKANGEIPGDMISIRLNKDPLLVSRVLSVLEIKGFVDYSMGKVMAVKF